MTTTSLHRPTAHSTPRPQPSQAQRQRWNVLRVASASCLLVIFVGQLIFAGYVVRLYGTAAITGQMERWNQVTPRAWLPDGTVGNLVFGSHVLFTVVVVIGGIVQLSPFLRRHAPALHRWNGRTYLVAAIALALGGTAMILTRGTVGGVWQQVGTVINGAVILICAGMAWRQARARRFAEHRRWALRLFLCVSGVFFFRIGLMAWLMAFRAPVGFDTKTFSGPFLTTLSFAQFIVPLLILQLVLHAEMSGSSTVRRSTAALLFVVTAATAVGIVGATMRLWLPRL